MRRGLEPGPRWRYWGTPMRKRGATDRRNLKAPRQSSTLQKYRAVIEGATPKMNWSAKGGTRSSLQYRGEGVTHSPTAPRCLRTARYGRTMRDLRRTGGVSGWHRSKQTYKRERNGEPCSVSSRTASWYLKHS